MLNVDVLEKNDTLEQCPETQPSPLLPSFSGQDTEDDATYFELIGHKPVLPTTTIPTEVVLKIESAALRS